MRTRAFPELRPTGWDAVVVLAVAALAAAIAWQSWRGPSGGALTAVIDMEGRSEERVVLSTLEDREERTVTANGYTLQIALWEDGAAVTGSDCLTQDCVHTGTISRAGQSIVCLPARVIVRLEGAAESHDGPDMMLG